MAKTKISEYDAIAANNTDVNSINIAEGCAPSGINNAIRQVMADLKDFQQGTKGDAFLGPVSSSSLTLSSLTANRVLYTNGSKVVATSDNMQFDGTTTTLNALTVDAAFAANGGATLGNATGDALTINSSAVSIPNGLNFGSDNLVLSGGNVGIGTSSSTAYANYVNNTAFRTVSSVSDSSTSSGSNIGQLAIDNLDTTANNYSKLAFTTSDGGNRVVASGIYTQVTARTSGNFVTSNMQFWTGTTGAPPAERMRIDSSGNVLIGRTSGSERLSVQNTSLTSTTVGANIVAGFRSNGSNADTSITLTDGVSSSAQFGQIAGSLYWMTGGSERMRIDSSGNLLVGATGQINGDKLGVTFNGQTQNGLIIKTTYATLGSSYCLFYNSANGLTGQIVQNGTNTVSYSTSSDYRLKDNVTPMTGALATVAQLKPVTYNWKLDGSSGQGFIAHELQAVVPDCVTGEKDAVDAEGKPKYQGIDTSFLVATLTAAIQEQQAIIVDLKSRIETLENK